MNPSSTLSNKKNVIADASLLPPKQTEWRKYSKTLIEELKEKLEDRRTKTLALLSEDQDLSAFREIDTESDGLDDTSTNTTSRHERQSCDNPDLTPPGQLLATSSLSEASLLTDSDCCEDDDGGDPCLKRRYCPFAAEFAGCDGLCTLSSYSTTSSIETDEMSGSKSAKLTPPPQGSAETMTLHGRTGPFKEQDFFSGLPSDVCKLEKKHACDCLCGCPCGQDQVTAAYMVRRSSSHCFLNVSTSLAASVRLAQSFIDLRQEVEPETHLEMTSTKVSYFAEITAGDHNVPFDISDKQKDICSVEIVDEIKRLTEVETRNDEETRFTDELFEEKETDELIGCLSEPQCEDQLENNATEHAQSESIVAALAECTCTASDKTTGHSDEKEEVAVKNVSRNSGDKVNQDRKIFATDPKHYLYLTKQVDPIMKDNQSDDRQQLVNADLQESVQGSDFDTTTTPVTTFISSTNADRLSPNFKWKNLLEEIYNAINDSIMEDINKTIMTGLKLRMNMCSPGLNVSGNSGYQNSAQRSSSCDVKRSPGDAPAESGNQQLKTCLEKVRLASTLQKNMAQAKSSVASMAARKAYETAIGDFDSVMGDFLKSHSPPDNQLSKDQAAKADASAGVRRSDTFVIDKDWHLEHSRTSKIEEIPSSINDSDVCKLTSLESIKESRADMQNTLPEHRGYDLPPKFSPTYFVSQKVTEAKRKKKRKNSKSKVEKIGPFLTGNKMLDTKTFVLKHFHSGANMDSESDSSDSCSETPPEMGSCKYTSSMLAQLLDYDSQEEKPNESAEKTELDSELNAQSIDAKSSDEIRTLSNFNEASKPACAGLTGNSENLTCSNKLDSNEIKSVPGRELEVADDDYESDFNAGSISECIQEEEKSDDKDSDLGLNFKTGEKKDLDSATFNVDRAVESQDCSEIELTMDEEIPVIYGQNNLVVTKDSDVEMSDLCEESNCLIETQEKNDSDIKTPNVNDYSTQKEKREKDTPDFLSADEMFAIPALSDLFNQEDIIDDGLDVEENVEEKPRSLAIKNRGECQCLMDNMSNDTEKLATTTSGVFIAALSNKNVLKSVDSRPGDSSRSPFIPMVEWSSSEEDIFDDLTRDKSPSDILRQKQKEVVDEKLKQLTQISKRRRKSRSPVSYKLAETSVNLQMLLRNALKKDNESIDLTLHDTENTSQTFDQKRFFAVLKSPVELERDPGPAQPSVSDLLLARISEEDTNIEQDEATVENAQINIQTEKSSGAFEPSRFCDVKCPTHPSRLNRSVESPHRFAGGVSAYTAQSPKKSTILGNATNTHVSDRLLSSQTASTEHTSMSSTSGEYNFPDNVVLAQVNSVGVGELTERSGDVNKARDSGDIQIVDKSPRNFGSFIATDKMSSFKQPFGRYGILEKNENITQAPHNEAQAVDNMVRVVRVDEPVISSCGNQQLFLTAVTHAGPSVVCETNSVGVGEDSEFPEGTGVCELRHQLSKILNCVRPGGQHTVRERQPVRGTGTSLVKDSATTNEFYDQESIGPTLYPTPNSQEHSRCDRYDAEDDVAITDDSENYGVNANWKFVGDVDNFNLYLDATKEIKNHSQFIFKVINPEFEVETIDQAGSKDFCLRDNEVAEDTRNKYDDKIGKPSDSQRMKAASKKGGNLPRGKSKLRSAASSFFETNTNAEVELVEEKNIVRNELLQSLLDKITLLERLVSQSQQSVSQQLEDAKSPQTPRQVDTTSFFPFLQREVITGHHVHHSSMSTSVPFLCTCHVHDYPGHGVRSCCDCFGMCGHLSNRRCHVAAHSAAGALHETPRHLSHNSTSSQTEAPSNGPERAIKTQTACTQRQTNEESTAEMNGRCDEPKQTRQIGFQTELVPEKCSCLQQCLSSIDNLESLDNRLHRELVDCVYNLKKDTETLVNSAYDRMTQLLTSQLNEALDKTNQSVSTLINTYNQTLTQQLADVNRNMAAIQNVRDALGDTKGQTTKRGMDYDTLKMRVVELTSQRDAEKVFHKITRESLRALERDHDRLRQEYVRATYRRLNHNSESEVRQRIYHLLNEPDDVYKYSHRHDRGHHSKYTSRRTTDDVSKFYPHADESHTGHHRIVHSSNFFKDLTQKNISDPNSACPETSKSKTHRRDKRAKHFGARTKEAIGSFDIPAISGNNQSAVCEVVNENPACCQVELRPSRMLAEDGATSAKDFAQSMSHLENQTKADNLQKSEKEIQEEVIFQRECSLSGRYWSAPKSGYTSVVVSAVSKDDEQGRDHGLSDVPTKGRETRGEFFNLTSDAVVDLGATDSKSSLNLSNDSF